MFAKYYDKLMEDIDYSEILEPLLPYLNKTESILDAGCGPGYILKELLDLSYNVVGIDNDPEMLKLAENRIQNNTLVYHHDLNTPLNQKYDKIIMLFDVINYFEDIKPMIKNIYDGLNDQGIYLFDAYKEEYLTVMKAYQEKEIIPFKYQWDIKTEKNIIKHQFKVSNEFYEFNQYVQTQETYFKVLKEIGFKQIEIISGNDERKDYYLCKK